jgi:hypothetical protein
MTLITCIWVPNGIALSGDSRTTGGYPQEIPHPTPPEPDAKFQVFMPRVLSDSTRKVFVLNERIAVGTWGDAFLGDVPVAHQVDDFATASGLTPTMTVSEVSDALARYMATINQSANLSFVVVGYDRNVPCVIELHIGSGSRKEWARDPASGSVVYNYFYAGDNDIARRLMGDGSIVIPVWLWNLQDGVDFSRHLIRTTIGQMRFEPRSASVGGHIDTVVVTPAGAEFLAQKAVRAG